MNKDITVTGIQGAYIHTNNKDEIIKLLWEKSAELMVKVACQI